MSKNAVKEKPKKAAVEAVESDEPRYCLSGSGKVVKSKKALFAMGGDATLKSRITRGDVDGSISGFEPLSKEALKHARDAWPHLFGPNGKPLPPAKKPKAAKPEKVEKTAKAAKTAPVAVEDEDDEDEEDED